MEDCATDRRTFRLHCEKLRMKDDCGRHRSILDMLMRRFERPIINNANRACYIECMVALGTVVTSYRAIA